MNWQRLSDRGLFGTPHAQCKGHPVRGERANSVRRRSYRTVGRSIRAGTATADPRCGGSDLQSWAERGAACVWGPGGAFRRPWPDPDAGHPGVRLAESDLSNRFRRRWGAQRLPVGALGRSIGPSSGIGFSNPGSRSGQSASNGLVTVEDENSDSADAWRVVDVARLPLVHVGPLSWISAVAKIGASSANHHQEAASHSPRHPASKSDPHLYTRLSPGAWLFPHASGNRRSPSNFKGHGVRTPQRAGRSRTGASRPAQGSLFGAG